MQPEISSPALLDSLMECGAAAGAMHGEHQMQRGVHPVWTGRARQCRRSPMERCPMRIPFLTILAIGACLASAPAGAQTYDPRYPVCMHVYSGGNGGGG